MSAKFHFPNDIPLENPPLAEAWLEIHWRDNEETASQFTFALGSFRRNLTGEFDKVASLDEVGLPAEIFPHIARYRFQNSNKDYPLIQLGPAVATVNFTSPYTWEDFKDKAVYLRENLNSAFEKEFELKHLALRYRNFIDFDPKSENLFHFLKSKLNTEIKLPDFVPGDVGNLRWASGINLLFEFELKKPTGKGKVNFITARKNTTDEPLIIFQLEVISSGAIAEYWTRDEAFSEWLEDAHNVAHEWFFSFIDGDLRKTYQ